MFLFTSSFRIAVLLVLLCGTFAACEQKKESAAKESNEEVRLITALKLYPDSALLTENLAQLYRDQQEYGKAQSLIAEKIMVDSSTARWHEINGVLQLESGDTLQAIDSYKKAFALQPNEDFLKNIATLYAYSGNDMAIVLAGDIANMPASNSKRDAIYIKGLYYQRIRKQALAVEQFDLALKDNYTFSEAYIQKAISLSELKNYTEAVHTLDKAIAVQNNNPDAWYYKGQYLEALGEKEAATKAYEMVLLYSPGDADATDAINSLQQKK